MFPRLPGALARLCILVYLLAASASAQLPLGVPDNRTPRPEKPFRVTINYILDGLFNVAGGAARGGTELGNLNLFLDYDDPWPNGSLHAHFLVNHGGSISAKAGDFQALDHIEAAPTVTLYEAFYEHRFWDDRFTLLGGIYAVDSEFDTRLCSSLFVHSSPGTGGDISQLSPLGVAIYPQGALGFRARYEDAGENFYIQTAVLEGLPGDADYPYGTSLRLQDDEGLFVIGETGSVWHDDKGQLGKVAVGAWGYTRPFETHLNPNLANASNRGAYLSLEKRLYRELDDARQGLDAYIRVGTADGRVNPIETFAGVGLVYTGLFSGRDQDRFGLAIHSGIVGEDYLASGDFEGHETGIELTYSFAVSEALQIQPDVQYIVNPSFDPKIDNAWVVGARAVWTFEI